ncbi:helix-turn-helix domain-containing protein [Mesorhizobium amorphae]|uniref:Helix-turn-helix domain-containing protein n=1 Tax=Mesorhizobium amorphae CCNWGS0123 TaxID=1082933 RepID=G6YAQ0_9HYPH|nr:AraC family transcriptional regulator [Mesorhizobium amorphae]ANT53151.1 AraC family transcriptional regulator [Mesorhizobium amorphae CCNWGS0123]EHH11224.1 helix-turn-helix domain-containing protein [Mesorhizobium amorphae CCNWGS0123]GLR41041.1 AraC family transcriptional regulator [Mesorhizobium amorphae]
MLARVDTVLPLPENVLSLSASGRAWNGVSVNVNEWRGSGRVVHRFPHEAENRLIAILEEVGSPCEPRLRQNQPCRIGYTPRHVDFIPAGMEMWGYSADVRFVRDVKLTFDVAALDESLASRFDRDALSTPRLRFSDDRIWTLVKLLAEAVDDPDPSAQLYGDGLTAAIMARLLADPPEPGASNKGLAPWQLRRVVEYLDAQLPERVDLAQLAALAGLSQAHFSRAFKASTGMAPYRWQLDQRIRRAKTQLIDSRASLDQVAEATGFADAVHFGRTFRKLAGATPAAWRRDRKS